MTARNAQGVSPLSWAAYLQQPDVVELVRSRRGTPDFHEACIVGDAEVVRAGLAHGQDVDQPAADGFTPLGLAVFFGQPGIAQLLINAGADLNRRASNPQQVAPIHAAVARNDLATLELLLARGADPDLPQAQQIRPLHEAAGAGRMAAAALLLLFGADPAAEADPGPETGGRRRPAELARARGHAAIAERLEAAAAVPRPRRALAGRA